MSVKRLIHEIHSSAWLIAPDQASHYYSRIAQLMIGDVAAFEDDERDHFEKSGKCEVIIAAAGSNNRIFKVGSYSSFEDAPEGSVALISLEGPVMKNDSCGDAGTASLAKRVAAAAGSQNIRGILLKVDSPGGTVAGTQTLADAIREARASKPVVAFIEDGMMASAAYWIGSSADEIVASHKTDEIGSIGVYTTLMDYAGFYKEKGITVESIYSSLSTQKNEDFRGWLKGKNEKIVESLDFIANEFIAAVKSNRAGKLNTKVGDPFKGRLFRAEEAMEIGLIDSIGDFTHALDRINALAAPSPELSSQKPTSMNLNFQGNWKALNSAVSVNPEAAEETAVTAEHLTTVNAALETMGTQLQEAQDNAAALQSRIDELTAENTRLQEEVATLGKKPGAAPSGLAAETTNISTADGVNLDELPHNKRAAALGF